MTDMLLPGLIVQAVSKPRSEIWAGERLEKAAGLGEHRMNATEKTLLAIENSVENGFLGSEIVGLPLWIWIILSAVLLLCVLIARRFSRTRHAAFLGGLSALLVIFAHASTPESIPVFYADDPLSIDPDTLPFPEPVAVVSSELYSFLANSLNSVAYEEGPAVNVNTTGDVPNSSWFEERHYRDRRTVDELTRGQNAIGRPEMFDAWNVVELQRDGKSIGMQIVDGNGDRFFLKFDPSAHPETSTGAEIVTSRFLHAIGYHVPEEYIVRFRSDHIQSGRDGVTAAGIEDVLGQAYRYPDGTYRALASRYVEGQAIGPFQLHGTRPDDANDIFPHELRRELRGLRMVAAWLNHTDMRPENTLAAVVPSGEAGYVRHYLIDFGTTLGGSPLGQQRRWAGHEYRLEPLSTLRRILTLGIVDAEWESIAYPQIRGVGRFEAAHFHPQTWVPGQPNPAFRVMDAADAFWAAARIGWFTEEEIRAIVEEGEYSDSRAIEYITSVLVERRDRITERYIPFGGGIDRFVIVDDSLGFRDLLTDYGLADTSVHRTVFWSDGFTDAISSSAQIALPAREDVEVEIRTPGMGLTRVYLRKRQIVGVERCGADGYCDRLVDRQELRQRIFAGNPTQN